MSMQKFLYVYILKCSDGAYYTGVTNNPDRRLIEHNGGINKGCFTCTRLPVEMVYCEKFKDYNLAISWEKRIKDWSRKKKEALINGEFEKLKKPQSVKMKHTMGPGFVQNNVLQYAGKIFFLK